MNNVAFSPEEIKRVMSYYDCSWQQAINILMLSEVGVDSEDSVVQVNDAVN